MKLITVKRTITKNDIGKIASFPFGRLDIDEYEKLKFGKCFTSISNFRSNAAIKLFDKWWGVCALIAMNHQDYKTREDVSDFLLIKIGEVDYIETKINDGNITIKVKPKSIAWDRMDVNKFEEVFAKAESIMCELLGCSEEELFNNDIFPKEKDYD